MEIKKARSNPHWNAPAPPSRTRRKSCATVSGEHSIYMKLSRHGRDLTRAFCLTKRNWGPAAMVKIFEGRALIFAGAKIAATFSIAAACLRDCALNLSAQKDKTVPIQERTIATTNHHLHTHIRPMKIWRDASTLKTFLGQKCVRSLS